MPLVTIVMPTYNGARYIQESIDSCLQQTLRSIELIVVVDARTADTTLEILNSYADERLKVMVAHEPGQAFALNMAFTSAQGEYFSWTHDDNVYLPTAIDAMVAHLSVHPDCHMVLTRVKEIDERGTVLKSNSDLVASFLYRKTAAQTIGEYDPRFDLVHDSHYWFRMAHHFGTAAWLQDELYLYRKHAASRTSTQGAKRALISLKMHCDLYKRSFYPYSAGAPKIFGTIQSTFFDRLGAAALHKDATAMQEMVALARELKFEWAETFLRKAGFYQTPLGWGLNRLKYALRGAKFRLCTMLGI